MKFNGELSAICAICAPLPFTFGACMSGGVHPWGGARHNGCAREAQGTKSVIATCEATIGVGFKNTDGKGGGGVTNAPSFTD